MFEGLSELLLELMKTNPCVVAVIITLIVNNIFYLRIIKGIHLNHDKDVKEIKDAFSLSFKDAHRLSLKRFKKQAKFCASNKEN